MQKTLRRVLFTIFFLAFFVVGGLLIVKTQGLVFDPEKFTFVKTGGVYVRSLPADVQIHINGEPYERSISLWNRGTLIKDLRPGIYEVSVEAAGRTGWAKPLLVEPGFVAAATNIRLFEENPKRIPVSSRSVDDFWVTREGIVEKSGEKLYFKDTELTGSKVLESDENQSSILTEDAKGNVFFVNLTKPETAVNAGELFSSLRRTATGARPKISEFFLHPFSLNSFLVRSGNTLYAVETKKLSAEAVLENKSGIPGIFTKSANEIFWMHGTSTSGYNFLLSSPFSFPLPAYPVSARTDRSGNIFFLIDEDGGAVVFDRGAATSSVIAKDVKDIIPSPDSEKALVIGKSGRFSIYYSVEDTGDVKIPKGTVRTLPLKNSFRTNLSEAGWWENFPGYLWTLSGENLNASETDTRPPVNAVTLFTNAKKIRFYGKESYVLHNNGELSRIDFVF